MKHFYPKWPLLLFSVVFSICISAQAQEKTAPKQINGTVISATDDLPLPGVTVTIKGTNSRTATNTNGVYQLKNLKPGDVLIFTYIGFISQEIPVEKAINGRIDVNLTDDVAKLSEVVVVGYGTQKKSEVTGSIGIIKADQLDQFSGGSINTSLQGKIAGLQITTNSGEPGSGANITLRGVSSINGTSSPLIIIDGIPVNNDAYTSAEDGVAFSPLNDLNPSDIASIEVLKDAATASIYGSRASNGVILITTKTGSGKTPTINFSVNSSIVDISRKIGILNGPQFRDAFSEAIFNSTGSPTTKKGIIDSLHPYYRDSYNWQDIMYRKALQYKADISVSGASKDKQINYFVSAGYRDLKPVIINTNYKQVYATARLNYTIRKSIKGSTSFNLSNYNYNRLNTGGGTSSIIFRYLITLPIYSPYDPVTGEIIPLFEGSKISPLAQAVYTKNEINRWRILGKQDLSFDLAKNLTFKTNLGLDYSTTNTSFFSPPILSTPGSSKSVYATYNPLGNISLINENTLTYNTSFNKVHNLNFLLGESYQVFKTDNLSLRGSGYIDNVISSIGSAAVLDRFSQGSSQYGLFSLFTRLNYNYKSKYLISGILRRDGSSRFGADNRYAYFPAVSAGWQFSQEDFFKQYKWLYAGKIRASYGITGNQDIGNYASQGSLSKAGSYLNNVAIVADGLENKNLKWESTKTFDIGTDLAFLDGRINFTFDYYQKNTSDLLFNVQIPIQTGYGSIPYNFGSLSNKGFDFQLDGVILNAPVKWSSTLTFGLNRNKVTSLPDGQDYRPNAYSLARVGQPVGVFYGLKSLGVYARDEDNVYRTNANGSVIPYRKGSSGGAVYKGGDVRWDDANGDGVINDDDLQIIGNPTPQFFGGLQNSFAYKGFSLTVFFNYVIGNKIFNNLVRTQDSYAFDANFSTKQLRRWRNQGDVTDVPRLVKSDPLQNYAPSTLFVEDGSFIRLQNLALGYSIPPRFTKVAGIKNANIGISVQNLFTWGKYTGYDPEVSSNGTLAFGIDNGSFPKSRSYNLSLNIGL